MDSNPVLPEGCRVVRAWGVGGGAWNVISAIAWTVLPLAGLFLCLLLLSAGSALLGILQGNEAFEPVAFLKGLLTFVVLASLLAGSSWAIHRRKVLRRRRAEAVGAEAAYALACVAEPEALASLDREKLARWMEAVRRASRDVLLVDEACASSILDARETDGSEQVVLRGISRKVAVPFMVLLMLGVGALVWVNSDSWLDRIIGLVMDFGAGAWATYAILGREGRIGGDRIVLPGRLVHGAASWSPPEAVLTVRRFSLGAFAWFAVQTIGPGGVTGMTIVDRPDTRRALRQAIRLWTHPSVPPGDPGASNPRG